MQLPSMLVLRCPESNQKWPLNWFELAGVSWSEFAAGTLWAQLGHFGGESGGLNLAETRVRNVPGEGLEPSRGKPSQDFKSWEAVSGLLRNAYKHQHVPGCFAPKDVKYYERFSFVTGE